MKTISTKELKERLKYDVVWALRLKIGPRLLAVKWLNKK